MSVIPPAGSAAFTLMELLTVAAVAAILLALLLPALGRARERAWTTQCLTNYRTAATYVGLYAVDHDGFFPMERVSDANPYFGTLLRPLRDYFAAGKRFYTISWERTPDTEHPYGALPEAWACPAILRTAPRMPNRADYWAMHPNRRGMAQGPYFLGDTDGPRDARRSPYRERLAMLPEPSRYFFLSETGFSMAPGQTTPYLEPSGGGWDTRTFNGFRQYGHFRGFSVAFLDCHVRSFPQKRGGDRRHAIYTDTLLDLPEGRP